MAQTYGPQYPGIEDGLIFCFDPKNRDCWSGGLINANNIVNKTSGSISGMASTDVAGAIASEGYIDFDGTDAYIQMEDTNSTLALSGSNAISVAWWNNRDVALSNYNSGIGGHDSSAFTTGWGFWYGGGDQLHWEIKYNDGIVKTGYSSTDEWILTTGTYDGATLKLYKNAAEVASGSETEIITGTSNIWIGRTSGANNYYWNGKLGPCMIWNRALSAAEVLTNYNRLKGRFGL